MTIVLVWLHLLAAISWIGGMVFLSLVLAPLVRSRKAVPECMALFRSAALRFRIVVWGTIALLVTTGPLLLSQRGISITDPTGWPEVLSIKLALVGVLLLLTLAHDLVIGPRVSAISALPEGIKTPRERMIIRASSWIPRAAVVIALGVLAAAVVLSRS